MTDGSIAQRRRRKEARPAEIIEAALAEFAARGFGATRMEDIARRAGAAKGTVFRYFPTKEALFEAVALSRVTPIWDAVEAHVSALSGPCLPRIKLLAEGLYLGMERAEMPGLMRVIIGEGWQFPAIVESWHRLSVSRAEAILRRLVEEGVASGEFRASAVTAMPMLLMAPAVMTAIFGMTFGGIRELPVAAARAAHMEMLERCLLAGEVRG